MEIAGSGLYAVTWADPATALQVRVAQTPYGLTATVQDTQGVLVGRSESAPFASKDKMTSRAKVALLMYEFNPVPWQLIHLEGDTEAGLRVLLEAQLQYLAGWHHAALATAAARGRRVASWLRELWTVTAWAQIAQAKGPWWYWWGPFLPFTLAPRDPAEDRRYAPTTSLPTVGIYPALDRVVPFQVHERVLDLGGGAWDFGMEYLGARGAHGVVYDPGARPYAHTARVQPIVDAGGFDRVIVAHVLNVIEDPQDRRMLLETARRTLRPGGVVYLTIWEGDRSSIPLRTERVYQRNAPVAVYLGEINAVFARVKVRGDWIEARRS